MKDFQPPLDYSRGPRRAAQEMLRSPLFFHHLRAALRLQGLLEGDQAVGVALYFVFISRFLANPLRVELAEATAGSAKFAVKTVCSLLEPRCLCQVFSTGGWNRFKEQPNHKIALVSKWSTDTNGGMRAQCRDNVFTRFLQQDRNGRVIEFPEHVRGQFACVSSEPDREARINGRWLTLKMPAPPTDSPSEPSLKGEQEEVWIEVQRLLKKRAETQILLPDWIEVFLDHLNSNEMGHLYVPAFLTSWKTMALLRSFQFSERWAQAKETGIYIADFGDLAHAAPILRIFGQGRTLPSIKKLYDSAIARGAGFTVLSPVTGRSSNFLPQRTKASPKKSLLEPLDSSDG